MSRPSPLKAFNLTLVSLVYYPNKQSTSQLFKPLVEHLACLGCQVTIVCGRTQHSPATDTINGVTIYRIGHHFCKINNHFFRRLLQYLSFSVCLILHSRHFTSQSKYLGLSNPPFLPALLWLISLLRGISYSLYLLDIYPDGLYSLFDKYSLYQLFFHFWHCLNRVSYHRADRVAVLGRDMRNLLIKRYHLDSTKVSYIPHWPATVTPRSFTQASPLDFMRSSSGSFTVLYSGNMGLWHDINSIVLAASLLKNHTDIHFIMRGNGIRRNEAFSLSQSLLLSNISWEPPIPLADLAYSLKNAHISLITVREGLSGVAVPCKYYGILASGRPTVAACPSDSEIALSISESGSGLVASCNDPRDLAECILLLYNDKTKWIETCNNAILAYETRYTLEQASQSILEFLGYGVYN